jgi:AraC-like DNA-binding protein
MDPLLDLIRLLRPRAALFGAGLDASGRWGLSFRKRDDLLFCWIERGECQLLRPGHAPVLLRQGDFALVYTSTPFALASDASAACIDSEKAVAATKKVRLKLGEGKEQPVILHAGKFLMAEVNVHLLTDLLPPLIHIEAGDASLARVRLLLTMNETEARQPGRASEFIIVRLIELVLVEILRSKPGWVGEGSTGLLAGLADPVTERALVAMHRDVAHDWSVGELARLCAVSRSSFATRFLAVVGTTPIAYLLQWRMALAKDELIRGKKHVGEIAFAIGFQSSSAFTTAFTRTVGCSPKRFAREAASGKG